MCIRDSLGTLLEGMGERARGFTPSPELLAALEEHPWPGNVRELKNLAERAVALEEEGGIGPEALGLRPVPPPARTTDYRAAREDALNRFERQFVLQLLRAADHNV